MKNFNFKNGFTIVEMLVAISILLIGVLGPLGVASRGISDGIYAKNQIAATYLAQEAMEVFINTRDTNLLLAHQWLTGIDDEHSDSGNEVDCVVVGNNNRCYVDAFDFDLYTYDNANPGLIDDLTITSEPPDQNQFKLQFCDSLGRYELKSNSCSGEWQGPIFTRWVEVTSPADDQEIQVKVMVQWFNKNVSKELVLSQNLFHLKP